MKRRMWLAAVAAVGALSLAACSSGGGPAPSSSSSGSIGPLGNLNVVQSTSKDFSNGGIDLAQQNGDWPNGLTVTQTVSGSAAQALATGDADIASTSPTRLLTALAQGGLDVTNAGTSEKLWDQVIVAAPSYKGKTIDDLKGATFGITSNGSAGDLTVKSIAKKNGWAASDYTEVTLGSIDAIVAALKSGQIDAYAWGGVIPFENQSDGVGVILGSAAPYTGALPTNIFVVQNSVINSRPDAVKAFCDTYYKENAWIKSDTAAVQQQYATWFGTTTDIAQQAIKFELDNDLLADSSDISDDAWQSMVTATSVIGGDSTTTADQLKSMYKSCDSL